MRALISCACGLWLAAILPGCSFELGGEDKPRPDPTYPSKAATHVVELHRVHFTANDMNENYWGRPLDIKVTLWEDGKEIPPQTVNVLSGQRGERMVELPIQWVVEFDPSHSYQLCVEEQAVISETCYWKVPNLPRTGFWPVALNGGRIYIGKESFIEFRDTIENRRG